MLDPTRPGETVADIAPEHLCVGVRGQIHPFATVEVHPFATVEAGCSGGAYRKIPVKPPMMYWTQSHPTTPAPPVSDYSALG